MPVVNAAAVAAEAQRILEYFESKGAERVEVDILQPAERLLSVYGEDIRARAYVTRDASNREMVMRPDFTVPLVSHHIANEREAARYAYCGPVFRKQETGSIKPSEYLQAGFEFFGDEDRANADAEAFAIFNELLGTEYAQVETGDLGILRTAVQGMEISERRKSALLRQLWRPDRFSDLTRKFGGLPVLSDSRREMLAFADAGRDMRELALNEGPEIGVRTLDEVIVRIDGLNAEAKEKPMKESEVSGFRDLLRLKGLMSEMPKELRLLGSRISGLERAADILEARADALSDRGLDPSKLCFAASYGRTTLEYYDGFVFGWNSERRAQIASGGRYDMICNALGAGAGCAAIGGVVRPEVLLSARAQAA